ncbi:2-hydroxychromene-2-carboxylate isomerase [Variovorax sp. HJSM1_2]|uniref:2-hydroxychromene-2-carboxylate isomerase n=1 Tax=Variovorax sp. HJSM1_2 TaxID=3366263 RepID=UPI003BBC9CF4
MPTIDYYFAPHSPWFYLGHSRFVALAKSTGAKVRVRPVDLAQVFPVSGGLPLAQRAPQRQAYRLLELKRYSTFLGLPLHVQPQYFPVASDPAAKLITSVASQDGEAAALDLAGRVGAAVWAEQRDIAAPEALAGLLREAGLPAERLVQAQTDEVLHRYQSHTEEAIAAGVFGSPTYVVDGELFWGQDRLDFLQRRLAAG